MSDLVRRQDVLDRIQLLLDLNDKKIEAGENGSYHGGYMDGLLDLLDCFHGMTHPKVQVNTVCIHGETECMVCDATGSTHPDTRCRQTRYHPEMGYQRCVRPAEHTATHFFA